MKSEYKLQWMVKTKMIKAQIISLNPENHENRPNSEEPGHKMSTILTINYLFEVAATIFL